jgi:hypothetical protein
MSRPPLKSAARVRLSRVLYTTLAAVYKEDVMHRIRPIFAAVLIAAAVAGCGGSSSSSSTKQTSSPVSGGPHALPPGQLGTYVRPGGPAGATFMLILTANGRYMQTLAGGQVINGVWSFRDGKVTFKETGGGGAACIGRQGTYSWSYAARKLTLSALSEPCSFRSHRTYRSAGVRG